MTAVDVARTTVGRALSVRGLGVTYRPAGGAPVEALTGVALDAPAGSTVAIVGESGSGKSTLLHALLGLLPPTAEVCWDALALDQRPVADAVGLRGPVGLVPQDPTRGLDPLVRIEGHFRELLRHGGLRDADEIRRRTRDALESVGVDRPETRARQYPHQLSGGQLQRVLVALALVGSPRVLLADEPTSNLDTTVQRRVLDLLDSLRDRLGLTIVLVTHDIAVAAERSSHLLVMKDGGVVESGPTGQVVRSPRHEYTRRLLRSQPSALPPRAVTPAPVHPPALEASGLVRTFARTRGGAPVTAVADLSLRVHAGRTLAVVGESGAGKTTALRMLSGLESPDAGTLRLDGHDVGSGRRARERLTQHVRLVHQNPRRSLNPRMDLVELVSEPLAALGRGDRPARTARATALLDDVGLARSLHGRSARELSGGQLQRAAIARALVAAPAVVVLDEPVSALDQSVQFQVLELLLDLQASTDVAYVLVSHDLAVVRAVADDVVVLRRGHVVESGSAPTVLSTPTSPHTRELLDAVPAELAPPTERTRS